MDTTTGTETEAASKRGGLSPRDILLARRSEAAAATTIDLDIPGYKGALVARYRLLDATIEGRQIAERLEKNYADPVDRNYYGALDTLIAACTGFYYRDQEGSLTLIDDDGMGPMGYDKRLADFLEFPSDSARHPVEQVFNNRSVALLAHVRDLNAWMEHPTSAAALGEAQAGKS